MNGPECWETRRHRFRNGRCDFCGTPEASDSYAQGQRDERERIRKAVMALPPFRGKTDLIAVIDGVLDTPEDIP